MESGQDEYYLCFNELQPEQLILQPEQMHTYRRFIEIFCSFPDKDKQKVVHHIVEKQVCARMRKHRVGGECKNEKTSNECTVTPSVKVWGYLF